MYKRPTNWRALRSMMVIACLSLLSACTNLTTLLFYPDTHYYRTPEQLSIAYQTITLTTEDGSQLRSWIMTPKTPAKASILFLHGNGENISTHMGSIAWITEHGYEVFMLDYRGYGKSTGVPTLPTVFEDIALAHEWLSTERKLPIILIGQSMGGALAITYSANLEEADRMTVDTLRPFSALVSESAPASWPQIARDALSRHWLTWLAQAPASLLPSDYDPVNFIAEVDHLPLLLMHSQEDSIVGFEHFETLRDLAPPNTQYLITEGPHIASLAKEENRQALLKFLKGTKKMGPL